MPLRRTAVHIVAALSATIVAASSAQPAGARRALLGEWTGTLVLDNSSPRLALVFEGGDSAFAGKAYSDGSLVGPMDELSLKGDTVHFKVDRLDFTGRISGTTMAVDLIVYNGTHRALTLKKTPLLHPPGAPSAV